MEKAKEKFVSGRNGYQTTISDKGRGQDLRFLLKGIDALMGDCLCIRKQILYTLLKNFFFFLLQKRFFIISFQFKQKIDVQPLSKLPLLWHGASINAVHTFITETRRWFFPCKPTLIKPTNELMRGSPLIHSKLFARPLLSSLYVTQQKPHKPQ